MRILLITQNESMFLPSAIDLFLRRIPKWVDIVGIIVLPISPFGKKKSLLSQLISTLSIFGLKFVIPSNVATSLFAITSKEKALSIHKKFLFR